MQATIGTVPASKSASMAMSWAGRVIGALAVLFLLFDGVIKVMNIQPVVDASVLLGLPVDRAPSIGILLLACVAVYLIPRTAVLGAVLLTGYLGGAIALQMRVGAEPFSLVFPLMIGALLWGSLLVRDRQLRGLLVRQS